MLEDRLFNISIGVLLGDASIQKNRSKRAEKWRLKFSQGGKHREYIYHLHNQFKEYVISEPFFDEVRNMYSFQTIFDSRFKAVADLFLDHEGRKRITDFFKENPISPISLAYWFMDDGGLLSYKKDWPRRGLVFNTQGFTFAEVERLSKNLNQFYNLKTWVKTNKRKPIIAVSGREYQQISRVFLPHMHESMRYKLPIVKEIDQADKVDDIV